MRAVPATGASGGAGPQEHVAAGEHDTYRGATDSLSTSLSQACEMSGAHLKLIFLTAVGARVEHHGGVVLPGEIHCWESPD